MNWKSWARCITDISVNPNNVDDSQILNERADKIKEKTPELNEMHTDGGYGSEDNDKKFEELKINQITTAVRGRESETGKKIEQISGAPDVYTVECPFQKVESTPTRKRHKVRFDMDICRQCPLNEKCRIFKNKGRYYFTHEEMRLLQKSVIFVRNFFARWFSLGYFYQTGAPRLNMSTLRTLNLIRF